MVKRAMGLIAQDGLGTVRNAGHSFVKLGATTFPIRSTLLPCLGFKN